MRWAPFVKLDPPPSRCRRSIIAEAQSARARWEAAELRISTSCRSPRSAASRSSTVSERRARRPARGAEAAAALRSRRHAARARHPLGRQLPSCARSVRRGEEAGGASEARVGILQHGAHGDGCWRKERADTAPRSSGRCGDCLMSFHTFRGAQPLRRCWVWPLRPLGGVVGIVVLAGRSVLRLSTSRRVVHAGGARWEMGREGCETHPDNLVSSCFIAHVHPFTSAVYVGCSDV